MKKAVYSFLLLYCLHVWAFERCDISYALTRPLMEKSIAFIGLVELAENESIVDEDLFYDELCKVSLYLCNEVILIRSNGYSLSDDQNRSFEGLFDYLRNKFEKLPIKNTHQQPIQAITLILKYTDFFLKENMRIKADSETA